ncbi:MAG: hypothetical protein K2F63_02275, partial [Muribaculaceae bacterium]|nr:hypothetical protein [Muribaculaceae bacterium]
MAKIQNPDSNREREIYSRAALADFSAVGELVFTRLHPYFCGIVKKYRASASDCYIEEVMHAFLEHIATPTSEGLYRLRSLNPDASPKTYM